jgi:hypothetical protein
VGEVLYALDMGTFVLVQVQVRAEFSAETTLQEVASLLRIHGLPQHLTLDRVVRFVSTPPAVPCRSASVLAHPPLSKLACGPLKGL